MKVFISQAHSSATSKKLMAQLAERLNRFGVTASTGLSPEEASDPAAALRHNDQALQSSDKVLLVVDRPRPETTWQDRELQAVLEAAWRDPGKLIPVFIGDVKVPTVVRSAVRAGQPLTAIRIEDPKRDWSTVADKLVKVFKNDADLGTVAENFSTTKQDRAEQHDRLAYVKTMARTFDEL